MHHNPAVFGTQGTTVLAADHQTQSFGALVVHLNSPGAQQATDAIKTGSVLHDIGHDGFWEQSQWVAGKDDAGNAQGMLVLDRNNNGVIETTDILHMGGDTPGSNNQTNSMAWLDAKRTNKDRPTTYDYSYDRQAQAMSDWGKTDQAVKLRHGWSIAASVRQQIAPPPMLGKRTVLCASANRYRTAWQRKYMRVGLVEFSRAKCVGSPCRINVRRYS